MIFGIAIFLLGYSTFYWGLGHFPNQTRYSYWQLLGFSVVNQKGQVYKGWLKSPVMPVGPPVGLGRS